MSQAWNIKSKINDLNAQILINIQIQSKNDLQIRKQNSQNKLPKYALYIMEQTQIKIDFIQLKNKYAHKLNQTVSKEAILLQWIKKHHLQQFITILEEQSSKSKVAEGRFTQKVLDQNDVIQQNQKVKQNFLNKKIVEAVKTIIQIEQINRQIGQHFQLPQLEQIISKVKQKAKDLVSEENKQSKQVIEANNEATKLQIASKPITKNQNSNASKLDQQVQPKKQQNGLKNVAETNKILLTKQVTNKQIPKNLPPQKKQPSSNSLFVQKEAPLSQQNIFKGLNNSNRPSSRLYNKNNHLMNQKPKSSAKSNRSKKSNASANKQKGQGSVGKKSEHFSDLDINQNRIIDKNSQQQIQLQYQEHKSNASQQHSEQTPDEGQGESIQIKQKKKNPLLSNEVFQLPSFKLSNQKTTRKKSPVESILTNPYIKKTFTYLCKQSYIGGGQTFDQISQSKNAMTLNKWMVFCKEFQFLPQLKKHTLVDIFQQCAKNKTLMNQEQFLSGLILVQNKLKIDEEDFIKNSMNLHSQFAFKEKLAAFKINYAGPKHNYFQEATKKPLDRYYQQLRQEKYRKEKQKQKQFILHQGKFHNQIQSEISQRKQSRLLRKANISTSLQANIFDKSNTKAVHLIRQQYIVKSPYLKYLQNKSIVQMGKSSFVVKEDQNLSKLKISRRIEPLTYSEIFGQKNSTSTRAFTTAKKDSGPTVLDQNSVVGNKTEIQKKSPKLRSSHQMKNVQTPLSQKELVSKSKVQSQTQRVRKTQKHNQNSAGQVSTDKQLRPKRQWAVDRIKDWADQFNKSQSQQSDQILKQHLKNEKAQQKNQSLLPQRINLSRIIQEYQKDKSWLQDNEQQEQPDSHWQRQTQLQITKHGKN